MTESIVGMDMFTSSSREAWETLASAFAATSFACSSCLCQQMAEMKKHDMTITVYFTKMKALADELTSIGHPLRYVVNVSIIFDAPCLFYTNCFVFCLHFLAFLCIFWN
jgi:hypothetical protein